MAADVPRRFAGIERLYGAEALARLAAAHVCVIGIGGVGSWAAEALARSGVGLLDLEVERAWGKEKRNFRLIVEVTERTIDRKAQHLLAPEIELEGWWTSLDLPAKEVIEHYQYHGANDCVLHLGAFAYNCLRLLGQLGLPGEIAPIRHPAKRRRLKTVLQEIMYRAAKFVAHARRLMLDFGRNVAEHVKVFVALQERLVRAASP
jgi:hypothetical protein